MSEAVEEKQVIKEVDKAKAVKPVVPEVKTITIYIGPTIPGVVKKNTSFSEGLPKELEVAMEETPMIKALVVSESGYVEAVKALAIPGGRMETIYKTVEEKYLGGK